MIPSRIQRTEQYRDSSIPSLLLGAGSVSHLVAAASMPALTSLRDARPGVSGAEQEAADCEADSQGGDDEGDHDAS